MPGTGKFKAPPTGRPKIANPLTVTIAIPLTPEDKATIIEMAAEKGVTPAKLIRSIIFDRELMSA